MTFPAFKDARTGQEVFVNPLQVWMVRQFDQNVTRITFVGEHQLSVNEEASHVAERIWSAAKALRG